MTTFLLIRHGATDWVGNRIAGRLPGISLSEQGRHEAAALAARLPTIDAVYSSPLERTRETASALGRPFEVRDAFLEIDYGQWTGCAIADLDHQEEWRRYNHFRSTWRIPGGETTLEVQARVIGELERLRAMHVNQTVAIVTHADVIRAAVTHYLGMPLDHLLRLEISRGSVTTVEVHDYGARVLGLNQR